MVISLVHLVLFVFVTYMGESPILLSLAAMILIRVSLLLDLYKP